MAQRRTKAQIAAENQATCAAWYGYAREALLRGHIEQALYWQNGAQAHFAKTAHYTGLAKTFWS